MIRRLILVVAHFLVLNWTVGRAAAATDTASQGLEILSKQCWACHSESVAMSELRLTSREAVLKGGKRGPAAVPGDNTSRLLRFIRAEEEFTMPPAGKLSNEEIATLERWVLEGLPWPGEAKTSGNEPAVSWWAFEKPSKPEVPQRAAGTSPIDAFIDRKLEKKGLSPALEADKRTLVRRAFFDLHGLPPSAEQIETFLADNSPDAWSRLVDRLLDSPRYGEKWGRHWLDLVRYADTAGFETDPFHLDAWRYRDYVIQSFNEDKPFDRFIKEQLAGDELWPEDPEAVTATGYFRVGPHRDLQVKVEKQNRTEKLSDYVSTTSEVFLGLTVGCARCHDHKFDPIPQRDYYRMQAIFEPAVNERHMLEPLALLSEVNKTKREFKLYQIGEQLEDLFGPYEKELRRKKLRGLDSAVLEAFETEKYARTPEQEALVTEYAGRARVTDPEVRAAMSPADRERLEEIERRLVGIFKGYAPPPWTDGIGDSDAEFPESYIWLRGNPDARGESVQPGFLTALGGGTAQAAQEGAESTGRRTALAEWIADPDNPLTARVMVNRIWQYHFGRGLVATPSDFGIRAQGPSHPELLDWLAVTFIEKGWSIKEMHRLIMATKAYRRSANAPAESRKKDPENVHLSYFTRRRLSAEEVRDAVLKVSGALNLEMGGIPVVPPLEQEELYGIIGKPADAWPVTPDRRQYTRRSIYLLSRRTFTQPMFAAFDKPDGIASCPRRNESTAAPQALTLLNSKFMMQQARVLAEKAPTIEQAWRRVLGRNPREMERRWAEAFLKEQELSQGSEQAARRELARALLNLNEFLYVE